MSGPQMTLELARQAGEEGMQAAAQHAERADPGWTDVAFVFLVKFAARCKRGDRFTAEAITDLYREDPTFVQPPDHRAWGSVFVRAMQTGILAIADFNGVRKRGHGVKGAKRYRSLVCGRLWTEIAPLIRGEA